MSKYAIRPGEEISSTSVDKETKTRTEETDALVTSFLEEINERYEFLEESHAYLRGAPLNNEFNVSQRQTFTGMHQLRDMSRNNYAKLIVSATTDRLGIIGFRTAAAQDETGDDEATRAFDRDDMGTKAPEAMGLACAYRSAYLLVDPLAKRQKVIAPSNAAVISDSFGEPIAGLTLHRDRVLRRDVLTLYARDRDEDTGEASGPVEMFVATREYEDKANKGLASIKQLKLTQYDDEVPLEKGRMLDGWVWWKSPTVDIDRVPVTPLKNKEGLSEFEDHTDVIDRLNHMIFQRVIIATMQAFRQRAVKGDFPEEDKETGEKIDYEEEFASGPGIIWTLPPDSEIWESTPTQYSDNLLAVKEDTKDLASATYTPMSYFSDSGSNSAEGAALQRDNYDSKIDDRMRRFGSKWKRHISVYFEAHGDTERANEDKLEVIWMPKKAESLVNRSASLGSMLSNGIPLKTALREAMGMTPKQIQRTLDEKMDDAISKAMEAAMGQPTPVERSSYGQTAETTAASATNNPAVTK